MSLYLVRHGQAGSHHNDAERRLTAEGQDSARRTALLAKQTSIRVSEIISSKRLRARETAQIIADVLTDDGHVIENELITPDADYQALLPLCDPKRHRMLVGHLPIFNALLGHLVLGDSTKTLVDFDYAAMVCLENYGASKHWHIQWMLVPANFS